MKNVIVIGLLGATILFTGCIPLIVGAINHQKKVRVQDEIADIKLKQLTNILNG